VSLRLTAAGLVSALLSPPSALAADASAIYASICAACHQAGGAGAPGLAPALVEANGPRAATDEGRRYLVGVLLNGLSGKIRLQGQTFNGAMPSQAQLSNEDLASVLNLVVLDFNRNAGPAAAFTADEFAQARARALSHKELRELRSRTR
jgi:mono/diheme cytochrome c family protein